MLGKIQEISTNLDKKRVYTAVGALVVALATGHVMQRNVVQPNVVVDMPSQQASMTPAPVSTPTQQTTNTSTEPAVAAVAEDDQERKLAETTNRPSDSLVQEAEVTRSGSTAEPMVPMMASDVVEMANQPEKQHDMNGEVQEAALNAPEPVATTDTRLASLEIASLPDDIRIDIPEGQSSKSMEAVRPIPERDPQNVEVADVTRAATDQSIAPTADETMMNLDAPLSAPLAPETDEETVSCDVDLRTSSAPGAMVRVLLLAPCLAEAEVEFDHAGLRFTETLDDQGTLNFEFPAMTTDVALTVTLDGQQFTDETTVSDMADYDRVALVWKGGTGLQLHALENGAFYGEAGHIWAETPGTPETAWNGDGGFLTVLGSTSGGYAADVYTYPASMPSEPAISIEAQVLETTCTKAVVGAYLRSSTNEQPKVADVGMIVPDCDAVGEYLVLKNLPQDLTIARN